MQPRILSSLIASFLVVAATHARADSPPGVVVLNTFSKTWVVADDLGPRALDGTPLVTQNTGCGVMDANVTWDQTTAAKAASGQQVLIGAAYTRSDTQPNGNGSFMQGGFAFAKLTPAGVELGAPVDLPRLEGQRAFMRPLVGFTPKYALVLAASEDNNSANGNPKPVAFLVDKSTGQIAPITNSTRGPADPAKPTDLIQQALTDGVAVQDPNGQRGPHMIVPVDDRSFLVGLQYNNQAQEALRVSVSDDGAIHVNWLERYSATARHTRPQVAYRPGAQEAFVTGVEANNQPAEIGIRLTKIDVATGKAIQSGIVIPSEPAKNAYVAEPSLALLVGNRLAIGYAMVAPAKKGNANGAGHAGGAPVPMLTLFDTTTLTKVGESLGGVAQWSRHSHVFATTYGPKAELGVAVISGSSSGTSKGFEQLIPLKADGTLGVVDPLKVYTVSTYSDVANLQARGKRNPNDQAKGFINGLGGVPNPGYTPTGDRSTKFMPEVSHFSMSVITGFSNAAAATVGKRESLWLSLVPAAWMEGIQTTPGQPTDKPGTNADGTGPSPRTDGPATQPTGEVPESSSPSARRTATESTGGCSFTSLPSSSSSSSSSSSFSSRGETTLMFLVIAGTMLLLRRVTTV